MTTRIVPVLVLLAVFELVGISASVLTADEKAAASQEVMPLHLPEQKNPEIQKLQDRVYVLAMRQVRYLLTLAHPVPGHPDWKSISAEDPGGDWVRRNALAVQSFSFLHRFGPYDEKQVGVSRKELLEQYMIPIMRYLIGTHPAAAKEVDKEYNWANGWQSTLWAQHLARAAWWSWDDLPGDIRQGVREIIANEADFLVPRTPPHELHRNTKAEENAWMSLIFDKAVLLMPNDPRRPAWENAFRRWALSSFLRPADEHSQKITDGRPLSEQFTGANIFDDFTLENHNMIHPDYMGAIIWPFGCALDFAMTGRKLPDAASHNVREINANLQWFFLRDGGCVYPNGQDWELFNIHDWNDLNILMAAFTDDPNAWSLVKRCWETTEKMAARDPAGAIVIPEETVWLGISQSFAEELARYWLMLQYMPRVNDRPEPLLGVKRLDYGKIVLHRTPKAVHSVSWGKVVMAQCVPWRLDRIVSPDTENGVGRIRLKNEKRKLPLRMQSAGVVEQGDGFTVDLILHHGDAVRAELRFRSNADGSFTIREKLVALKDITTAEIATGTIGVLNNPKWVYETHRRQLRFDQQSAVVPALSGDTVEMPSVKRIDIHGGLLIESPAPLSARYVGTKNIERGRATDRLYLNYLGGERAWKSGGVISTYEATLTPQVDLAGEAQIK